jgi:O-antigen ligase
MQKWAIRFFLIFLFLSLLTPFLIFKGLYFPYVTSKAFFLRICVELTLPFYLYLVIINKKLRPDLKNPLNFSVLTFLLLNIITAIFGVNIIRSLWGNFERMGGAFYLAHLVALYFYVLLLGQLGGSYLKRFLQAIVLVAVIITLNGFSGWLGGPMLANDFSLPARVSSTLGNPIFFASFLILPLCISVFLFLETESRLLKWFYGIAFALQLWGVYMSGTRGALVGLVVGLFAGGLLYVILVKNKRVRQWGWAGIGLFVAVTGLLFVYHSKLPGGSTMSRLFNLRDSNSQARLIQWGTAVKGFKDHPLLGVGPENYYVIANKYFNPQIYQYDASWFDKPHNYLLEILVTNGAFGFAVYASILISVLWGLYKAFKADLLSLGQFCALIAGFLAYIFQNLFVFDTVSASLTFYAFAGFAGYLYFESKQNVLPAPAVEPVKSPNRAIGIWSIAGFAASSVAVLYIIYTANALPMAVASYIRSGNSNANTDAVKAAESFAKARAVPDNFDQVDTAGRYTDFVVNLAQTNITAQEFDFALNQVSTAAAYQRSVAGEIGNDALSWYRLANLELINALAQKKSLDGFDETAINKALVLAPNRVELLQVLLQLRGYQKNWPGAVQVAESIAKLNPYNPQYQVQLATAYYKAGRMPEARNTMEGLVKSGYKFQNLRDFTWLIDDYWGRGEYQKAIPLLNRALNIDSQNLEYFVQLAEAYAKIGDVARARTMLETVVLNNPGLKPQIEPLLQTLK